MRHFYRNTHAVHLCDFALIGGSGECRFGRKPFVANSLLPIDIRLEEAGVDGEDVAADQPLLNASAQHGLNSAGIARAKTAMPVI
jgi:hypothetical protein